MRDVGSAAVAGTTTLLAVYLAGVIFVAQHVADRYSPLVFPRVAVKFAARWTVALVGLALASLLLALLAEHSWTDVTEAVLLTGGLGVTLVGLFRTFQLSADRTAIVRLGLSLRDRDTRATALRDMTWNAVTRGDPTAVELVVHQSGETPGTSRDQAALLEWITQYPTLLEQPWLRHLLVQCVTAGPLEDEEAEIYGSALLRLFRTSLDRGWFDTAEDLVLGAFRAVDQASSFGENHAYLLFDIGFAANYIGEEGRAAPRTAAETVSLDRVQEWFEAKVIGLRRAVIRHADRTSTRQFCLLLERLAQAGIAVDVVVAQVWETIEGAYPRSALDSDCLEALANTVGAARFSRTGEEDQEEYHRRLDETACHVALYAALLGDLDQVSRMMGNARLRVQRRMPMRLVTGNEISEVTYTQVAKSLGLRTWHRD